MLQKQRHHYVPQFYLRKWNVSGKAEFWLYCRDDEGRVLSGCKSARSVGYQKGLYSTMPDFLCPASNDIEEKFFSPLDSAASLVHQKLLVSGVASLSAEERCIWSLFVNSLLARSPTKINEVIAESKEDLAKTIAELKERFGSPDQDRDLFWDRLDLAAMAHNAVLSGMVKWVCNVERINFFNDLAWVIVRQPEGEDHFLTGDSPIVINGGRGGNPIHLLSIALSPGCCL